MEITQSNLSVSISKLNQFQHNPRKHPTENIGAIKKSLSTFGQYAPLIIDENFNILAGNGTFQSMIELGFKDVNVIQITGLSENQKNVLVIADNKLNEDSIWIYENLETITSSLLHDDVSEVMKELSPSKKTNKEKKPIPNCTCGKQLKIVEIATENLP